METITVLSNLETLGFTEKEAKVYIACLSLGTANMTDIARHAELKRSNTYFIIESLIQRGYVSRIQKGKIDYYKASNPEKIIYEQVERTRTAENVLPLLKTLSQTRKRSNVTFYEGKHQLEEAYDTMFRSKEIWSIVYLDEYWKLFDENHNRHLYELLKRHGGINHLLIPKSKKNIEYVNRKYRTGLQEVRFLHPHFTTPTKIGITFNRNMVTFTSYSSVSATCIEDSEVVSILKQLWLSLWNQSLPLTNETRNES